MHSPQFQLHAQIEERHWWFVGRRRIMRRLVEELRLTCLIPALVPSGGRRPRVLGTSSGVERTVDDGLEGLSLDDRPTAIDVGCGTGANLAALADRFHCVGIDASAEAVELAQRRFPRAEFHVGYAPDDLGDLMPQASLVMLMDVLEHVEDDVGLFASLVDAVSPGCHFLLTVPADPSLWSAHDEAFGHYRRYDRRRFERVWAALPVEPLLVSHFNSRLLPLIRLIRAWNRRRGRAAGAEGTDFWLPRRPINALLETILAGEAGRLAKALHRRPSAAYTSGASLICLLRRNS